VKRISTLRGVLGTMALSGALAAAAALAAPPAEVQAQTLRDRHWGRRDMRMRAARHARPPRAMWDRLLAAADELKLSDDQVDKLRTLRRSAPGILMPKRQAIAEARLELDDLMASKDADAASLSRVHERLVQARGALSTAAFDLRMQAREVLTPQQRNKLREELGPARGRHLLRRGALDPDADEFDELFDADAPSHAPGHPDPEHLDFGALPED